MSGFNKVILMGNVGQDPELRQTAGSHVLNFRLATTDTYYNKTTQKRTEDTQWHNIVVWGTKGEALGRILTRGSKVLVEGRLQNRNWEDKQGNKRTTTEVFASDVTFAGPRPGGAGKGGESFRGYQREDDHLRNENRDEQPTFGEGDDIPF